jgi:splicing factor 3B subunit 2
MDTEGGGGGVDVVGGGEQPALADLARVFARFASAEEVTGAAVAAPPPPAAPSGRKGGGGDDDDAPGPASSDDDEGEADDAYGANAAAGADAGATKHSRRARKAAAAARVASLKRTCPRPEVVEAWDTTAPDPELLVALKATRNAVPVPRHWSQKRPYLAGKRGLERPPFELPAFIAATGVGEMRAAYVEKEGAASLKAAARARVRPKAGRLDLDYQVLHDAFFVHQTKPPLAGYGDVYYEGKEFEAPPPAVTPGALSAELREALGMPPDDPRSPPPWLVSMQRWGPPPSYPRLPIPGLSAPLPPGAAYGYQPGGWGKPPVDEGGRPLFGDAFGDGAWAGGDGTPSDAAPARWGGDPPPDKAARWGELAPDEEEEEEEEEGEGEEGEGEEAAMEAEVDEAALAAGTATAAFAAGVASTATLAGAGLATPAPSSLDLRKGGGEPVGAPPPPCTPSSNSAPPRSARPGPGSWRPTTPTSSPARAGVRGGPRVRRRRRRPGLLLLAKKGGAAAAAGVRAGRAGRRSP